MIHCKHYPCTSSVTPQESLVIIHGLFGNSDNWHSIAQSLSEYFHVYTLDLPNHGLSDQLEEASYDNMATLVQEWLHTNKIPSCFLLGHSMGGKVAMQFASQFPEHLLGLIVADIAPVNYQSSHHDIFAGLKAIPLTQITSRKEADAILSSYEPTLAIRQFLLKNLIKSEQGFKWLIELDNLANNYELIRSTPPLIQPFTGSTLFIKGEHSDYIQAKDKNAILHWFPQAEVKIIPATGHWLHAEKPIPFTSLVRRFCQKNTRHN